MDVTKALSDQASDAAIPRQVGVYPAPGQRHFGAGFDVQHLPESWSSTANANAVLQFAMKDTFHAVDDFVGQGRRETMQNSSTYSTTACFCYSLGPKVVTLSDLAYPIRK